MRNANLIDLAFFLKKSSLFGSLDLDILLSISDKLEWHSFRPMEMIFSCHQEAYHMYLIVAGQVVVTNNEQSQLAELSAGDFFGEESLFNEKKRGYNACCKMKADLLSLSSRHLIGIIHEFPGVALSLLESYAAAIPFRMR